MNDNQFKERISEDIGFIKASIKDLREDVRRINDSVANTKTKLSKHEVILTKVWAILGVGVFVLSLAINLIIDWIKAKLLQ